MRKHNVGAFILFIFQFFQTLNYQNYSRLPPSKSFTGLFTSSLAIPSVPPFAFVTLILNTSQALQEAALVKSYGCIKLDHGLLVIQSGLGLQSIRHSATTLSTVLIKTEGSITHR